MKKFAFVLFLAIGIFSFSSTLTLKTNAFVRGKYVTLYDLAATFDGVSKERLQKFIVAFAPQPGSSYSLDSESIKIRAEHEIKWLRVFEKSKKIKVTSESFVVDVSLIHNILEKEMKEPVFLTSFPSLNVSSQNYAVSVENVSKIGNEYFALVKLASTDNVSYVNVNFETTKIGTAITIENVKSVVALHLKDGVSLSMISKAPTNDFKFIEVGKPIKISTNILKVPVNFISKSKIFSTILKYKVALYKNVVVAAKNIPYGTKIRNEDLEIKKMDVYTNSTAYATSVGECVGKISMWSFQKGQIISKNFLKSPPDVVVGQVLIAYISYPCMTVTTFVRAMQDGKIGQVIAVRNVSNGYMFYGTIEEGPKICVYSGGE